MGAQGYKTFFQRFPLGNEYTTPLSINQNRPVVVNVCTQLLTSVFEV